MSLNKLKILAFQRVYEDQELCNSAKRTLMEYFKKEANEYELKEYVMDGEISDLDSDTIDMVEKRFNKLRDKILSKSDQLQEFIKIGTPIISSALGKDESQDLIDSHNDCEEDCEDYDGYRKKLCKNRCKLETLENNRELLNDAMDNCDRTSDPESCRNKINKYLEKIDKEISNTQKEISYLESEVENE